MSDNAGAEPSVLPAVFAAATVAWVLLLVLAPLAATEVHASSYTYGFAAAVYGTCTFLCHQLPARSFHLGSTQLPVCARCTGIYIGAAIAATLDLVVHRHPLVGGSGKWLIGAGSPTLMTLLYEWVSGVTPSNWIRFGAGVPLGAGVAILVIASLRASDLTMRAADGGSDQLN